MPWWVLIVLAALALGAFSEWLSYRQKRDKLAAARADDDRALDTLREELRREQARLVRRIEHLEAIVTDEAWEPPRAERLDPERRATRLDPERLDPDDVYGPPGRSRDRGRDRA